LDCLLSAFLPKGFYFTHFTSLSFPPLAISFVFPLILSSAILCITLAFFQMVNPFFKTAEVLIIGLHFKGFREFGFPTGLWEIE